jgi:hypothetical protein
MDQGLFTCTDPALTSRSLLGVLNWTITWYSPNGPLAAGEIGEQIANLFLRGLMIRETG